MDEAMANNRLYLVHRPTGLSVFLGKRLTQGWYMGPTEAFTDLYRQTFDPIEGQDDFCLAIEDATNAPFATDKWSYAKQKGIIAVYAKHKEPAQ